MVRILGCLTAATGTAATGTAATGIADTETAATETAATGTAVLRTNATVQTVCSAMNPITTSESSTSRQGMSLSDFYRSRYWDAMCSAPFNLTEWISYTQEEKEDVKNAVQKQELLTAKKRRLKRGIGE